MGVPVELQAHRQNWYVVRTLPHKERIALINLENQRFTTFCPFINKTIRRGRKLIDRTVPLFPGYLFVHGPADAMRPVRGTLGVQYLLSDESGRPKRVPPGFVEALQRQTIPNGTTALGLGRAVGDEVRVRTGPFADKMGVIDKLDDKGRVLVLLEIMARTVRVEMTSDNLG